MVYIQRLNDYNKAKGSLETVDQFETRKEAREMLKEYQLSDSSAHYYLSQKPCKDWLK